MRYPAPMFCFECQEDSPNIFVKFSHSFDVIGLTGIYIKHCPVNQWPYIIINVYILIWWLLEEPSDQGLHGLVLNINGCKVKTTAIIWYGFIDKYLEKDKLYLNIQQNKCGTKITSVLDLLKSLFLHQTLSSDCSL